jgi:hypothetical protein
MDVSNYNNWTRNLHQVGFFLEDFDCALANAGHLLLGKLAFVVEELFDELPVGG